MAGLPGIIVKITADVNDAISGINRVEQAVGGPTSAFDRFGKVAVAAGGAVAAAFTLDRVISFLEDSMRAAMEDEKSMVALAKAMENVGVASQNASVEGFIKQLSLATGQADDNLRPALQRIVTVTGDVAESQRALSLALDISIGSGRDLESVSTALAKAYGGQTTALGRLGVGLDAALLKSKDMDAITAALSDKFQGQAAAAAETYQGKMNRVTIAAKEAQETIGYALLKALDNVSRALGGTGGATTLVTKFGDALADLIGTGTRATDVLARLGDEFMGAGRGSKFMASALDGAIEATKQVVGGPVYMAVKMFDSLTSTEEANARAVSTLSARYTGLAKAIDTANRKAAERSGISVSSTTGGRDWSAFYQGNQAAQQMMNESRANVDDIIAKFEQANQKARNVGGSAAAAAQEMTVNWKQATQQVNDNLDGLTVSLTGKMTTVTGKITETFKTHFDAFKQIVGEQGQIIQQAKAALDNYAKTVTDTILGKINFSTTTTDAEGKTVPMTPDQIVTAIFGDIGNQMTAVEKMAGIITQLPEGLAQKLLQLPTTFQIQLADYLAAHPDLLKQLAINYDNLAKTTQTLLGIPMATTFAAIGGVSAVKMIENARQVIAESATAFKNFVRSQLGTTVHVTVVYDYPGGVAGPQPRAGGGPVSSGSAYIVGEVGPELFIPNQSGTIIPNSAMGNTFNINVSTGVGDPRQIGEQIVTYIKRFEQASGQVFASA